MPADEPRAERLRPIPELIVAVVAFAAAVALMLINLPVHRTGVIWGWLPGLAGAGAAIAACLRTAAAAGNPVVTQLFRHLWVVVALAAAGYAGQAVQAAMDSSRPGDPPFNWFSVGAYGLAMAML